MADYLNNAGRIQHRFLSRLQDKMLNTKAIPRKWQSSFIYKKCNSVNSHGENLNGKWQADVSEHLLDMPEMQRAIVQDRKDQPRRGMGTKCVHFLPDNNLEICHHGPAHGRNDKKVFDLWLYSR
ncbi:MAG: hypothetical protein Q6373_007960 [Candidatus Sigynarchaeota archaeon]